MSMTQEDASEILSDEEISCLIGKFHGAKEALGLAISALLPVSRERVEKAWRGCSWCNNEGKNPENWECSLLDDRGFSVVVGDEVVWTNAEFCPVCGKPLTDEAVQMVMERLEALRGDR